MYIPFSKHIALENKLIDAGIEYWFDSEMKYSYSDSIRFYFNKKDADIVEKLLKETKVQFGDFKQDRKLYFWAIALAVALYVVGYIMLEIYYFLFK